MTYSTDLVFRSKATLAPLYEQLARHSVLTAKVARRKLDIDP